MGEDGWEAESAMAGYRGKVGAVYAVITDFSLQLQRSEKTGTELGKPWTVSAPVSVAWLWVERVTQNGGIGRGRGRRSDWRLPPSQRAGPRLRASVLAPAHAAVPPDLYGA